MTVERTFVWGAATAAFQIEGATKADGRGESIWDRFAATERKVAQGDTGDPACEHYYRWRDDLDLMKSLGLDDIGVRQAQGQGQGAVKETIVTVGKQISNRWYVGYERGLNATTGSWQLIYRIAQRFTVRAQAGQDNAIDLNWTLRWN